jgi:hypothetical protein
MVGLLCRGTPELPVDGFEFALDGGDLGEMRAQALVLLDLVRGQQLDLLVDVDHAVAREVAPQLRLRPLHLRLEDAQLLVVEIVHALAAIHPVVVIEVDVGDRVHHARRTLRLLAEEIDRQDVRARRLGDREPALETVDQLVHAAGLRCDAEPPHRFGHHLAALHDVGLGLHHFLVHGHGDGA